jgi:hypothetical protein
MATKRKAIFPKRLYERGWSGRKSDEEVRLKTLNEAILESGFEDAKFIPNMPNCLVVELIWSKICKDQKEDCQLYFWEALKMRSISKFWLTFVDQTDIVLDLYYSFILK